MKRLIVLLLAGLAVSCGDMTRQGTGSSYLIVTLLEGASGVEDDKWSGTLMSDVITVVDSVESVFNDLARVSFRLGLKDAGSPEIPTAPTSNNFITVDRYRVRFVRADGRNVPGVDVPYAFDGGLTVTVMDTAQAAFTVVRHQAKREAPLSALRAGGQHLSTIAEITFYGRDQTGREVSATGNLSVNFGNFADPKSESQ